MTSNSEKNERSLAEFVVIVALVGVMMAIVINFFNKNESQFTQAGFSAIAQNFNTKVNAVHAQWMMYKQPNTVYLASLNNVEKQVIPVNKKGWIDVTGKQLVCEKIWLLVMQVPMIEMKYPISTIEVRTTNDSRVRNDGGYIYSKCRYVLLDGSYFQYNRAEGKVSKVIKVN
jgi:hypothetical protein